MIDDAAVGPIHERFADATRRCDVESLVALSSAEAVAWHNFDDAEISVDAMCRRLRRLHESVPDVEWTDVAVVTTTEGFVWRARITGSAPGGALRVDSCMVVTLDGVGLIRRIDEYLDPAGFAVLAAPRVPRRHTES